MTLIALAGLVWVTVTERNPKEGSLCSKSTSSDGTKGQTLLDVYISLFFLSTGTFVG